LLEASRAGAGGAGAASVSPQGPPRWLRDPSDWDIVPVLKGEENSRRREGKSASVT